MTARSSYDDISVDQINNDKNEQIKNGNLESMFLLDEFKKQEMLAQDNPQLYESINQKNNSKIFKDSLDVTNSVMKHPLNNQQASLVVDEDEAWKNEMIIYEKYLKEDLETYGKHLNEIDNSRNHNMHSINDSKAFSTKSSINSAEIKDKRMNSFNKNLPSVCNEESKEKIEKLKTSIDHLRREFHTDVQKMDAKYSTESNRSNQDLNKMNEIKRKICARKIQRWYRRHHLRIKAGEAALKRY